ncbi:MAG: hypothetical protein ACRCUF_08975 [Aeromonas sobria]
MTNNIRIKPVAVATTPRAGMSLGTDYFGIDGPSCAEWAKDSIKKSHEEGVTFKHAINPSVEHTVTVPMETMNDWRRRIETLRAEVNAHGLKFEAVISNPSQLEGWDNAPSRKAKLITSLAEMDELLSRQPRKWTPPSADFVMTELRDPDSMLNQGLADALDAKELERQTYGTWPTLTEQEIDTLLAEIAEKQEAEPLKQITINPMVLEFGEPGSPMRMVQAKKWLAENVAKSPSPNDVEDKCFPYLQEDVYIPSCQIVGKGVTDSCKHLIGRLDYCHECEHEYDEPIDLSEESI